MKSTIFSLVIVLLFAVTSAFGQVLLVDGSVNPGQIPDALAYRQLINYTQTPTHLSAFAKEGMIFTGQSDIVTFENVTASFPVIVQQQDRATKDSMTMTMVSQLLQSLTPTGATQLSNFEQQFKSYIKIYGEAGDTPSGGYSATGFVTANDVNFLDADWDAFGTFEGIDYGPCWVNPVSMTIAEGSQSADGIIDGINGQGELVVSDNSTGPLGQSGEPGAGTVYEFVLNFTVNYTNRGCSPPVLIKYTLRIYEEIAYTKLIWTGKPGTDCFVVGGRTVCSYPVNPLCYNTKNPDYMPVGVNDDRSWPAWYSLASCNATIIDDSTVWFCIPLIAVGTANITPANCTYNP